MTRFYILILSSLLCLAWTASACPMSGRLNDFNCNEEVRYLFSGDSVVAGVRDGSDEGGGYPRRLQDEIPEATIKAVATPGVTSEALVLALVRNFNRPGTVVKKRSLCADWVMLDVGRNDYWRGVPPEQTMRNLKRLVRVYRVYIAKYCSGIEPIVSVSTMLPTNRSYQRTYIAELNATLLRYNSAELPVHVRFDRVNSKFISWDRLHPSTAGYDKMAGIVRNFIFKKVNKSILRQRPDADNDGVADYFEKSRYRTSIKKADTDRDGYTDGFEIFYGQSDPRSARSTPLPTATPTATPEVTPEATATATPS